ncbi:MAG: glycosyltransferase family 4 protein [Actinomycetota bacterium]|nr:glycosyltransferase family 4 protein [Actinomycetota bacterium]
MRVLVISHLFPNSQDPVLGTFVAGQVRALSRLCEVSVVCPVPWAPPWRGLPKYFAYSQIPRNSKLDDVPVYFPRYFILPKLYYLSKWTFPLAIKRMSHQRNEASPFDVIHAHMLFPDGYAAAMLAKQFGVPLIITVHGYDAYDIPWRNRIYKHAVMEAVRHSDRIIAVSKSLLSNLGKLGVVKSSTMVIPNGADETVFFPRNSNSCRQALGLPGSPKRIILSVANLVELKGLDNLLAAFAIIKRSVPDALLYIVGHGHLLPKLRRLRDSLGINDSAVLVGARPHEELPLWFNAADLVVLPSLMEGLPTALIEAISCGKPIVASRVGGTPELITDSRIGLLVSPGDVGQLANAVIEALNHSWDSSAILKHAAKYSWNSVADKLITLYSELVQKPDNRSTEHGQETDIEQCVE